MLKRYYSMDEAAEYISEATATKISIQDILDMAQRRELRICTYIDECIKLTSPREVHPDGLQKLARICGYTLFPKHLIDRNTAFPLEIRELYSIQLVEDIRSSSKEELENIRSAFCEIYDPGYWAFVNRTDAQKAIKAINTGSYEYKSIKVSENQVVIPAEDLLAFRRGEKTDRAMTELTGKARSTLLRLVGGLLMSLQGMDIHADRLSGIGEVLDDLARVGVTMDDKTLRNWIKEAAQVIEPPPKDAKG